MEVNYGYVQTSVGTSLFSFIRTVCLPGFERGITRGNCLLLGRRGLPFKKKEQRTKDPESVYLISYTTFLCDLNGFFAIDSTWWGLYREVGRAASDSAQTLQTQWAVSLYTPQMIWSPQQQSGERGGENLLYVFLRLLSLDKHIPTTFHWHHNLVKMLLSVVILTFCTW